jgi:hypothetical protein
MKAFKEALKEAGRVVLLAVLPLLISGLENNSLDLRIVAVVGGVTLLRFVDKYMHELGKEENNEELLKGLTRF